MKISVSKLINQVFDHIIACQSQLCHCHFQLIRQNRYYSNPDGTPKTVTSVDECKVMRIN